MKVLLSVNVNSYGSEYTLSIAKWQHVSVSFLPYGTRGSVRDEAPNMFVLFLFRRSGLSFFCFLKILYFLWSDCTTASFKVDLYFKGGKNRKRVAVPDSVYDMYRVEVNSHFGFAAPRWMIRVFFNFYFFYLGLRDINMDDERLIRWLRHFQLTTVYYYYYCYYYYYY